MAIHQSVAPVRNRSPPPARNGRKALEVELRPHPHAAYPVAARARRSSPPTPGPAASPAKREDRGEVPARASRANPTPGDENHAVRAEQRRQARCCPERQQRSRSHPNRTTRKRSRASRRRRRRQASPLPNSLKTLFVATRKAAASAQPSLNTPPRQPHVRRVAAQANGKGAAGPSAAPGATSAEPAGADSPAAGSSPPEVVQAVGQAVVDSCRSARASRALIVVVVLPRRKTTAQRTWRAARAAQAAGSHRLIARVMGAARLQSLQEGDEAVVEGPISALEKWPASESGGAPPRDAGACFGQRWA